MREDIQELDRAINDVALKWYYTLDSSSAQKQKYEYELFKLLYEYKGFYKLQNISDSGFEDQFDTAVSEFWLKRFHKWMPDKSSFSKYFNTNLKQVNIDLYRKESKHNASLSLDESLSEDGDFSLKDTLQDDGSTYAMEKLEEAETLEETMLNFIHLVAACCIRINEGRKTSYEKARYFKIRYTDFMSLYIRREKTSPCVKHEDEMLSMMLMPFMDFTSDRICRSVPEIAVSLVKPYCQMVESKKEDTTPPKQPFQADVYVAYINKAEHKKVSDSSLSKHKEDWDKIMEEWAKEKLRGRRLLH